MALPYPSMSFVPLDILTAEEMNHIVANYTYLANQLPVGTVNIADNAVTSAKIDWSTVDCGNTSTDIRIGTFNGLPLYRRVEAFTNMPRSWSQHDWSRPFTNLNEFVRIDGVFISSTGHTVTVNSMPPDFNNIIYGISVRDLTSSNWVCVLGTSMDETNHGYVIVDYTTTS